MEGRMRTAIVPLSNHLALREAISALGPQRDSSGRFGRFVHVVGPAGSGKTTAVHVLPHRDGPLSATVYERAGRAVFPPPIRVEIAQGTVDFLRAIVEGIVGWRVELHRKAELYRRAVGELIEYRVPYLIIDDGDTLDQSPRFERLNILRDLSDRTGTAIVLLSTPSLARRFATPGPFLAQLASRIVRRVEFKAPTMRDAALLAELIENVSLARDVISMCFTAARGNLRALITGYEYIEQAAQAGGVTGNLTLARAYKLGIIEAPTETTKARDERAAAKSSADAMARVA
jgi:AAA domain